LALAALALMAATPPIDNCPDNGGYQDMSQSVHSDIALHEIENGWLNSALALHGLV